jgi:hypothetical protein
MKPGKVGFPHVVRWSYWGVLGASYAFALPFAVYLFVVALPLTAMLLALGSFTLPWPAATWLFPTTITVASAITAWWIAVASWGTDAAWAGPFMIWIVDAFLIVTFKLGQLYGNRRKRQRNERAHGSPQPI